MMRDLNAIQKAQFGKISRDYDEVHGEVIGRVYEILQERYYPRCKNMRILDVGNGGQAPLRILGKDVAGTLKNFVGLDSSIDMLNREGAAYIKVAGDGLHIPFKDKSFDYVILNGVIHHMGYADKEEHAKRVKQLISESLRVCRGQVIVYELVTSSYLESLERFFGGLEKNMPTFVLSGHTLDKYLGQIGVSRKEVTIKKLADLTSPFYWYQLCMDIAWFKLPACLSFYEHHFFTLSK